MTHLTISQPLYQQVYKLIKTAILNGEFKPGEKVVATQLVKKYNISRTPLREALRQLQNEGLLVKDQSGLHVVELDIKDFKDLYQCRLILEQETMQLIVDTITDNELEEIEGLLDESDRLLKQKRYLELLEINSKFHDKLLESSPNKRIVTLLQQVRSFLTLYRARILSNYKYNCEINREHREIYNAIRERNKEKAVELVAKHIKNDERRGISVIG